MLATTGYLLASRRNVARLDTDRVVDQVIDVTTLDIVEDDSSCMREGLIHIITCFRRRLEEDETIAFGELNTLLVGDLALFGQI